MNRRKMLVAMGLATVGTPLFAGPASSPKDDAAGRRLFNVMDFGATGGGATLDTAALNKTIDACNAAGGGTVYVPPGNYLCGTVILKSNVTFHLEAGAVILGSHNIRDYLPQPQSTDPNAPQKDSVYENDLRDAAAFHLIFARDAANVRISGSGRIDGRGSAFWAPSGRAPLQPDEAWRVTSARDWKAMPPRPSPMLEFYNCTNLHLEGIQVHNSAGWTLRPIHCDNVFIHGISIKNPVYGPNTDGLDLTCCQNVFVSDCLIDTGDDAICLKSENPYGEALRTSKNITITNCVLTGCCNGLKFGTATHGGYENIVFSNSVIFNEDVPLESRILSGIALEMVDGGWIEGVLISNIRMQRVRSPIFIRRGNRRPRPDGTPGTLRGVMIENLHATGSTLTSSITGIEGIDVQDVTLSNIRIDSDENGKADWMNRKIPEREKEYPEARDFGRLPAYGLYCRHITGLRLRNIEVHAGSQEERPAVFCDDVKDLEVEGLRPDAIAGSQPAVKLVQTQRAFIRNCSAPAGIKAFLEVAGGDSKSIVLSGNNLVAAEQAVQTAPDVSPQAVTAAYNALKT